MPINLNIKGNGSSRSSYKRKTKTAVKVQMTLNKKIHFQTIEVNICISNTKPKSPIHVIIDTTKSNF